MAHEFDVFISYASTDRDLVAPFVRRLRQDGFTVWFDVEQMAGGVPVLGQLSDAIAHSAHTVACLTDAYFDREFASYELKSSMHRDPSGESARTIPVLFRALHRELPTYIQHLMICDLTEPANYDQVYEQVIRVIRGTVPGEGTTLDREDVERICDAPFEALDDPYVALFQVRRANEALSKYLYKRELGDLPTNATLDLLIQQLIVSQKLPSHINASLATVQTYGNYAVRDDQMGEFTITHESTKPALTALRTLTDWTFERKPADPWPRIWDSLPPGNDDAERQIPNTGYYLRGPRLSQNSLGPLYAGRDAGRQEPVSVNLVALPEQSEDEFFEEATRFMRLRHANIVSPLDAGRVAVDGRRRCLFLVLPSIDAVSTQDLTEQVGTLPRRAAYELCLGIALALKEFHGETPPIVHGDIKPANVLVDSFGTVRVLCIGRVIAAAPTDPSVGAGDEFLFSSPEQISGARLTPSTDLFALHSVLFYLLTGGYPAGGAAEAAHQSVAGPLEQLARCRTATQACQVLEDAARHLPDSESLKAVNRRYRQERGLDRRPVVPFPVPQQIGLLESYPIESRGAWPLGGTWVLIWEMGTDTLAVLDGAGLVWRDTYPVPVRGVARGSGDRLAVGGWDGAVRYFAGAQLEASVRMDGAVGDLRFTSDSLVAGSWKRALWRIFSGGRHGELLNVAEGVHRIAVSDHSDQFAVADLSGGLSIYSSYRRVYHRPALDVSDLAYAGPRLVMLTDDALISMSPDRSLGTAEPRPGALRLLPAPVPGRCLLLIGAAGQRGSAQAQEAWLIDDADRQVWHFTLPAGHTLLSTSGVAKRFTTATPDGGRAYWRDGVEQQAWPDARSVALSADGRLVAVSRPGKVELYEDPL